MSKKIFSILLIAIMLVTIVTGCSSTPSQPADTGSSSEAPSAPARSNTFISIATGGTAGTYYPLGGALAKVFNDNVEGVTANAQSTGASNENVGLVNTGEAELAFTQNDTAYYSFNAEEMFADKQKHENLRGVTMFYPELIQVVALKDSGITSIEDMKGKRVAVGAPGSGTEANARQILAVHGLSYDDLGKADFLTFAEAADQLKNKQMDATFVTGGVPTSALTEVAQTTDVVIIPIAKEKVDELIAQYPFYAHATIPKDAYRGMTEDVHTATVVAMVIANKDVDEDLVYDMTAAIFDNKQTIVDTHRAGEHLDLQKALDGMPIPLHPGAERYYKEKGLL